MSALMFNNKPGSRETSKWPGRQMQVKGRPGGNFGQVSLKSESHIVINVLVIIMEVKTPSVRAAA